MSRVQLRGAGKRLEGLESASVATAAVPISKYAYSLKRIPELRAPG